MAWLLDTNVVSELRKGSAANPNVLAWAASIRRDRQFLSVLTLGEIHKGILRIRERDPAQSRALEEWFHTLKSKYDRSFLPICETVATQWAELNLHRTLPVIDGLLAATARVYHLRIATRNVRDFEGTGVEVVNPFQE